jgi:hypothetical protein
VDKMATLHSIAESTRALVHTSNLAQAEAFLWFEFQ